ncbi:MAG: patatin-like phospholipase family protein [Pseudonocardiaceae bacterium]
MQPPGGRREEAGMAGRALVLGSGGITGIAWELGMLAGLADHGVDLRGADLVVGTSAGSVVAALITSGADLEELYASQLAPPGPGRPARMGIGTIVRWSWAVARSRGSRQVGARVGRMALAAATVPEAERRGIIEARLGVRTWPRRVK